MGTGIRLRLWDRGPGTHGAMVEGGDVVWLLVVVMGQSRGHRDVQPVARLVAISRECSERNICDKGGTSVLQRDE